MGKLSHSQRWLAALAHLAVLLMGWGTAVPALVWLARRKTAPALAEQALQALVWQSLLPVYYQLLLLVCGLLMLAALLIQTPTDPQRLLPWGAGIIAFLTLASIVYLGVGIVAAIACLLGRDFVYPFFGRGIGAAEERVAGSMAHAGMFMPLIGMAVPLCILLADRQGSAELRFQSAQALAFQLLSNLLGVLFSVLLAVLYLPILILGISLQGPAQTDLVSSTVPVLLVLVLIFLLVMIAATLLLPLFALFAFIASIQVLRGREYVYPLLGGWLRRRLGDSLVERAV